MAKLQVVVDPTYAMLYVTGTGGCIKSDGMFLSLAPNEDEVKQIFDDGPKEPVPPLAEYRGIWGRKAEQDVTEDIAYSASNMVQIWQLNVLVVS